MEEEKRNSELMQSSELVFCTQICKNCKRILNSDDVIYINSTKHFYCFQCNNSTIWKIGIPFARSSLDICLKNYCIFMPTIKVRRALLMT